MTFISDEAMQIDRALEYLDPQDREWVKIGLVAAAALSEAPTGDIMKLVHDRHSIAVREWAEKYAQTIAKAKLAIRDEPSHKS